MSTLAGFGTTEILSEDLKPGMWIRFTKSGDKQICSIDIIKGTALITFTKECGYGVSIGKIWRKDTWPVVQTETL